MSDEQEVWQAHETRYLRQHYKQKTACEIAEHLGKTRLAVTSKAARLGLGGLIRHPSKPRDVVKAVRERMGSNWMGANK